MKAYHLVQSLQWGATWAERILFSRPTVQAIERYARWYKDAKFHCVEIFTGTLVHTNLELQDATYYHTHDWPLKKQFLASGTTGQWEDYERRARNYARFYERQAANHHEKARRWQRRIEKQKEKFRKHMEKQNERSRVDKLQPGVHQEDACVARQAIPEVLEEKVAPSSPSLDTIS